MKFAFRFSIKNIYRKPYRAMAMALVVMFLSFAVFTGGFVIASLRNGLAGYQDRLGADIVVVPRQATSHGAMDDILLSGITGNYYMSEKYISKIEATEGIAQSTRQFFLTSAKASCCSRRVQIIGFEPETDFSILPWIREKYEGTISDGDVVVGGNINIPSDRTITFYGQDYHVAARLSKTGTGLDSAVYTNMNTIRQMGENAANLLSTSPFKGVDIRTAASAVLIRVKEGYDIQKVADDINIHVNKVEATPSKSMVSDIARGLGHVSRIIGVLIAGIWVLAVVILIILFTTISNERKKEFAVLRTIGASRKLLFQVIGIETGLLSLAGALCGLLLAAIIIVPLFGTVKDLLDLPFLMPGAGGIILMAGGAVLISVMAGLVTSYITSKKMTGSETGLLLKEDA